MQVLALALSLSLVTLPATAAIDADKAAELSRAIREQYRLTGFNWISPKMLKEVRSRAYKWFDSSAGHAIMGLLVRGVQKVELVRAPCAGG